VRKNTQATLRKDCIRNNSAVCKIIRSYHWLLSLFRSINSRYIPKLGFPLHTAHLSVYTCVQIQTYRNCILWITILYWIKQRSTSWTIDSKWKFRSFDQQFHLEGIHAWLNICYFVTPGNTTRFSLTR